MAEQELHTKADVQVVQGGVHGVQVLAARKFPEVQPEQVVTYAVVEQPVQLGMMLVQVSQVKVEGL